MPTIETAAIVHYEHGVVQERYNVMGMTVVEKVIEKTILPKKGIGMVVIATSNVHC